MRLGFFFGAGAEIGYGLPSGGRFAIELFRQDVSRHKQILREQLQNGIDRLSPYATNWLPDRFESQRIHAFGKNEFSSLIESSIEYRKAEIIRRLNQFDIEADLALNQLGVTRDHLARRFKDEMDFAYGTRLYNQVVRLNPLLAQEVPLFGSIFYSAMLDIVRTDSQAVDLRRFAASFIQLLVGAHGQELVQRLNQELFTEAPDDIPIFDDISGIFRIEVSRTGFTALELLLEERREFRRDHQASLSELFSAISQRILENIFETVLDYQSLIDSHFRYLYSPKTEWAKFTKMTIFLRATHEYITSQLREVGQLPNQGYYHDLQRCEELGIEISAIGTANYNNLIENISTQLDFTIPDVKHLNGGVNDYYNPYKNCVISCDDVTQVPRDQIYVPFILTQSGLKPLTSVNMSRRYVALFDRFVDSDGVVVVGYGFNVDDCHINGMFRELVEEQQKPLIWICPIPNQNVAQQERELAKRLRITTGHDLVHVISISAETRLAGETLWLEAVKSLSK